MLLPSESEWTAAFVACIAIATVHQLLARLWRNRHGVLRAKGGGPPFRKLLRDMASDSPTPENIRFGVRLIVAWVGGGFLLLLSFFIFGFGSIELYFGWASARFPWLELAALALALLAIGLGLLWAFTFWVNRNRELLKSLGLELILPGDLRHPKRRVAKLTADEPDPELRDEG